MRSSSHPEPQTIAPVGSTVSWGASVMQRLPPQARRYVQELHRIHHRIAPALPILVVAVMMLLMAVAYFNEQHYYTKQGYAAIAGFADIGWHSGDHLGLGDLVVKNNPVGFDGQFFYYIALDPKQPLLCGERPRPSNCALDIAFGEVRAERILYPYTAGLLTLGMPHLVPYSLLFVNLIAILLTSWLVAILAIEAGASRWMGAAAGLFCGEVLGMLRDLADPFAVFWVVLAVYLLRKERYLLSALAVGAALLSREQLILTLPLLFLPLLAKRRWSTLAIGLLIGLGPFFIWQIVLRAVWGRWALTTGDTAGAGVAGGVNWLPFYGLWTEHARADFGLIVAFVVIPLLLAVVIAVQHIWLHGPAHLLHDPVPALIILYTFLLSLTSGILWQDMWTPGRLSDLAVVLGVIVVSGLPKPSLHVSYATLLSISSLAPIILVIR